jgi:hypothetical protein
MSGSSGFNLRGRNPDILTCIANLSNDEVFTPPEFANQMLDTLTESWAADHGGANIWADKSVRFLDPCTKSGVYLREITRRLIGGLAEEIPDLQDRVDHILTQQVFGIGITQLTAMLARRSVYCSRLASGNSSVAKSLESDEGWIWFKRTEHSWKNGKCKYCGASKGAFGRGKFVETHAYAFIHVKDVQAGVNKWFGQRMQFDVVIGNPPYQLSTDGFGTQAKPIYQHFVMQAKALNPRYLCMVIPSRWFSGGMGLDEFRQEMLSDDRLRSIDDFLNASDVFQGGMGGKGGVCFFLWNRDSPGECTVTTHLKGRPDSRSTRPLLESGLDVFIRFNEGLSILRKVIQYESGDGTSLELPEECKFMNLVSSIGAYGLESTFRGRPKANEGDLKVYRNGGIGYIHRSDVTKEEDTFDDWKVFIGRAAPGTGNRDTYPHRILSTPFLGEPGSISSWTYLYIGPFKTRSAAESVISYLACRFTRFLIMLHKPSQDTTRRVYKFVPKQSWDRVWTDEDLYSKYGISAEEQAFIEDFVRPMDVNLFGELADE